MLFVKTLFPEAGHSFFVSAGRPITCPVNLKLLSLLPTFTKIFDLSKFIFITDFIFVFALFCFLFFYFNFFFFGFVLKWNHKYITWSRLQCTTNFAFYFEYQFKTTYIMTSPIKKNCKTKLYNTVPFYEVRFSYSHSSLSKQETLQQIINLW